MKNLFNFKWLLLCIVLSIASVSQIWGVQVQNEAKIYFDATNFTTKDVIMFTLIKVKWDDDWTEYDGMSRVGGNDKDYTNLYYLKRTSDYNDLTWVCVIGDTYNWTSGKHVADQTKAPSYTEGYSGSFIFGYQNEYYVTTDGNTNGSFSPSLGAPPSKTQTVYAYIDGEEAATSPAQVNIHSYVKSGDGTVDASDATTDQGGSSTTTFNSIVTAKTTLSVSDVASGKYFAGWSTTGTRGSITNTSTTYPAYHATDDKTMYACFEAERYEVTVDAGTHGTTSPTSGSTVTAGYYTTAEVEATAKPGFHFTGWTLPDGVYAASGYTSSSNPIKINATASGKTISANYERTYAYIEGRFRVWNVSRSGGWTYTESDASKTNYNDHQTYMPFSYDDTKHLFYRRTYATPSELSSQLASQDPWFFIKTCESEGDLSVNLRLYRPSSSTSFENDSEGNKTDALENQSSSNFWKFASTDISGYVVIYFDESKLWYEIEPATFNGGQENHETEWNYAANWSPNVVPTSDLDVLIQAPVVVDINNARAKSVKIYNDGSTKTGKLTIGAGKALIVEEDVKKTTDGSTKILTTADVLKIEAGNTSSTANGALVWGTEGTPGAAQVDFCTKSHGVKNDDGSVNQYIGTPFSNDQVILYQYYYSWMYKIKRTDGVLDWELMAEGESMNEFEGYNLITAYESGTTYQMDGTLVSNANVTLNGSSTPKLIYSGSGDEDEPKNENVLANSWVAPIRINTMSGFSNVESSIYIFNAGSVEDAKDGETLAGTYSCYSTSTALASDVIPSMQSFSVYATGASPSLTLNYNTIVKSPLTSAYNNSINKAPRHSKADEMKLLKVRVQGAKGWADELKIYTHEEFSTEFEDSWDAHKMYGYPQVPQLYAVTTDGNLAIDCVPTADNTVLGFKPGSDDSEYTFSFMYEGDEELYLKDTKTSIETPISSENSYTFTSESSDSDIRFVIRRAPAVVTGMEELNTNGNVQKIMHNGALYIVRDGKIYSIDGALVK